MTGEEKGSLARPEGRLAYRRIRGRGPGLVWLGGFASDMTGTKAEHLAARAQGAGRDFLRFDYSGHGASEGRFEDGSITRWTEDALAVFDAASEGPQILVGSSMGGWIASLLALRRPERVAAIVFIAPAPDFTEALIWATMDATTRERLMREGRIVEPSPEGGVTYVTRRLVEDGRRNLLLGGEIAISCPVRILHGMKDADVPFEHALLFAARLQSRDVEVTLVKDGDHRLSTPADLDRLWRTITALTGPAAV
jgi:pimeloyl-ACP methyl ester carboxylesterase